MVISTTMQPSDQTSDLGWMLPKALMYISGAAYSTREKGENFGQ